MQPLLSVVMASHKDRAGVWATLEDILQDRTDLGLTAETEIICVANDPEGPQLELKRRDFADIPNARLVHWPERIGTAAAKNRAIAEASGKVFVCLDCHVFLRRGVLAKLVEFWRENLDSKDIYFGPNLHRRLVDENGKPSLVATHMREGWGTDGSFGTWAVHPPALEPNAEPFPIALSGCGLFTASKKHWPGFHPQFRGFGPEECYIAGKYRKNGNQVICLPWLQWIHRYGHDPDNAPGYENNWLNRCRGNLLSYLETGYPAIRGSDPILDIKRAHVKEGRITHKEWEQLCKELNVLDPTPPVPAEKPVVVPLTLRGFPALNSTDQSYQLQLPCKHRGDQQALVKCNRGCPSQQAEVWGAFECKLRGQMVTLGKRRTDLHDCLNCPERAQATADKTPSVIDPKNDELQAAIRDAAASAGPLRKLAAVCCYYNPAGYTSLRENYLWFREQAKAWSIPLFAVELVFDDEKFPTDDAWLQLRGDGRNVLWQKERLLNLAAERLPKEFDALAVIDADLAFDNPAWADDAAIELQSFHAVQLFDQIIDLGPNGEELRTSDGAGLGGKRYLARRGRPGGAWAIRREVFPLYDRQIIGGGDSATIEAWLGMWDSWLYQHSPPALQQHWREWAETAWPKVKRRVSFVSGTARHTYHGDRKNRAYGERTEILRRHGFDPEQHLEIDGQGLLAWTDSAPIGLRNDVVNYFHQREEDDAMRSEIIAL